MIALISPAKIMRSKGGSVAEDVALSEPRFLCHADSIMSMMSAYSSLELSDIFRISTSLGRELKGYIADFYNPDVAPISAVDSFDGVVYKHIKSGEVFSGEECDYLQHHLRINSLVYGLLRPLDAIKQHRMEGFVHLSDGDQRVDKFWQEQHTQTLIDDVLSSDGELLYLAAKEEQNSFRWSEVCRQVKVIDFRFLQPKGDKLRQVVIYTKMARGEMVRYMMQNNITNSKDLKRFEWGGYRFRAELSTNNLWTWVMD
ncbi:MAG: YaaA family protein [Rikenellaceae bacterium]